MVIELIGEWNDAIENDIMNLKREVVDKFFIQGITKFILIAEEMYQFSQQRQRILRGMV